MKMGVRMAFHRSGQYYGARPVIAENKKSLDKPFYALIFSEFITITISSC